MPENATTAPETPDEDVEAPWEAGDAGAQDHEDGPETFSREYVAELRDEAKQHRLRARDAETDRDRYRDALWTARVEATGVLADPTDLPLDADALDDPAAVEAAARALVERKPHLARRRARGDLGQHDVTVGDGFSLVGAIRGAAGI